MEKKSQIFHLSGKKKVASFSSHRLWGRWGRRVVASKNNFCTKTTFHVEVCKFYGWWSFFSLSLSDRFNLYSCKRKVWNPLKTMTVTEDVSMSVRVHAYAWLCDVLISPPVPHIPGSNHPNSLWALLSVSLLIDFYKYSISLTSRENTSKNEMMSKKKSDQSSFINYSSYIFSIVIYLFFSYYCQYYFEITPKTFCFTSWLTDPPPSLPSSSTPPPTTTLHNSSHPSWI